MPAFYEFFAGGGMARAGLGDGWDCLFANDFDHKKGMTYQANWGTAGELKIGDIKKINVADIPSVAELAWGSFPCQDLSLAGGGAGLQGERSGTFYPFWDVMRALIKDGRPPKIIALENVVGTLTSHQGKDFRAICQTFSDAEYSYGALIINASLFVPQSRPRLFVIGVHKDVQIDEALLAPGPVDPFHTRGLCTAINSIPYETRKRMLWWNIPTPQHRASTFADLVEENPMSVPWHTQEETQRVLAMMSPINTAKVNAAKRAGRRMVGGIYKRTRSENGVKIQRAEVRFDDIAGCLRTPSGGSSRQTIIVVDGENIRTRLISTRETARLMGLSDEYRLPKNYNEAYHLTGDGVAVPVVRHLALHIFEPLLDVNNKASKEAA
ncbi:DNA cytosine methyltransferase [Asticcacaulis sp. EMRT-3]|uniref:DNA cytosine methyltransferase n=1 Tax=Asticcacaulis sp. EMRT-3 TaxID=3040349 RepID=UPI0024AFBEAE|nr:DNA cytosine methyltransferase [Asticcacaulis sp. EMRT-3]MDI7774150.1 DNA cytosine methyltransferase [Asticcacaulis sp. EMRT-3]